MAKVGLTSPWVEYYRKLASLFKKDPEISVIYDEEKRNLDIYVNNATKAEALNTLIPVEITFGNYVLPIRIIPSNKDFKANPSTDIEEALNGNGAVSFIRTVSGLYDNPLTYVVFKKEVVQYYTDDLGDYYGMRSTLYEDLAREVFGEQEGVFYCTDVSLVGSFGTPLGEWP